MIKRSDWLMLLIIVAVIVVGILVIWIASQPDC